MSKAKLIIVLVIGFIAALAALDEYRRRLPPPPPASKPSTAAPAEQAAAPQVQAPNMASYEDARIRFKHPKDWKVLPISSASSAARIWLVSGPAPKSPHFGDLLISIPPPTKDLVLLEEVYERAHAPDAVVVGTPRRVQLRNAECIIYQLEKALPKGVRSQMLTHCYDPDKNLVLVTADLDEHAAGESTSLAQQNREVYERILTSLEFR